MKIAIYYNNCYTDGPGNALLGLLFVSSEAFNYTIYYENISDKFIKKLPKNVELRKLNMNRYLSKIFVKKIKAINELDVLICWVQTKKIVNRFYKLFKDFNHKKMVMIHQDINVINYFHNIVKKNIFNDYLFCGRDIYNSFVSHYKNLESYSHIITNTIIFDDVEKNLAEYEVDLEGFNFISVGGLRKQKNLKFLLKVFNSLKEKNITPNLLIIGSGNEGPELKKYCIDKGLDKVFFLGSMPNPLPYVIKSDVYISSSIHEGLSISVLEAMSLRKPMVLSACSGNKEIIDNCSYAYGYDVNDGLKLENMIIEILNNSSLLSISDKQYSAALDYIGYDKILKEIERAFNYDN